MDSRRKSGREGEKNGGMDSVGMECDVRKKEGGAAASGWAAES
jgi:hypothetical protein